MRAGTLAEPAPLVISANRYLPTLWVENNPADPLAVDNCHNRAEYDRYLDRKLRDTVAAGYVCRWNEAAKMFEYDPLISAPPFALREVVYTRCLQCQTL